MKSTLLRTREKLKFVKTQNLVFLKELFPGLVLVPE